MAVPSGRVRIIGGIWRSRVLEWPPVTGLRPTPDRVRETVFNWLVPGLPGATCLDLFAGSGAMGFEALSRGARRVVMVEHDAKVLAALRANALRLGASAAEIRGDDAIRFLEGPVEPFNIVFVDPPYASDALDRCIELLALREWIQTGGRIYIESPADYHPNLPSAWRLVRSKVAGQVGYHLAEVGSQREAE